MVAYRVKTFADMYGAIMRRLKIPTTDTEALNTCKEAINSRYESIAFRKKWRWRRKKDSIAIHAKKTDGSVNVTNLSRIVTFTAGLFTATHAGWVLAVTGHEEVYDIIAVDTTLNRLYLAAPYTGTTAAATAYTAYKYQYGLKPNFEELDQAWHGHHRSPINLISPRELNEMMVAYPNMEGKASNCTLSGYTNFEGTELGEFLLNHDFLKNTSQKTDAMLSIFPGVPDEDYTIHVEGMVKITPLDNDTDEPLIPIEKRHVLVYGALADMYFRETNEDQGKYFDAKFENLVERLEADSEFTDEKPIMQVVGKWWNRRRRSIDSIATSRGSFFDRFDPIDDD